MNKLLVLGAGILQIPAIIEAQKMGFHVVTFDFDNNAPGTKIADEAYIISTIDIDCAVEKARQIKPNGVMTLASDMPLRTVASIAEDLDLPSVSRDTAYIATNKARMRERLMEHGVPVPKYFIINSQEEFERLILDFNHNKFIIKPADNSGSRGVYLYDGNEDLAHVYNYSKSYSRSGEILIEEYMEGPEVSVETFAVDGEVAIVAITDKLTTGAPFFVEMGHSQPSRLSCEIQNEISRVAIAANKALGITDGPSHTEIIVTKEGPKIVEVGARLGGDNITTRLVPLSTGVNLVRHCIQWAMGEKVIIRRAFNKAAVIRYFQCNSGKIASIEGIDRFRDDADVTEITFTKGLGDDVVVVKNSTDRIGFVICNGDNIDKVVNKCDDVVNNIKINVIPQL